MSRNSFTVVNCVIKDRRFLDDERLLRTERTELLEAVFNSKVRNTEIKELTHHCTDARSSEPSG